MRSVILASVVPAMLLGLTGCSEDAAPAATNGAAVSTGPEVQLSETPGSAAASGEPSATAATTATDNKTSNPSQDTVAAAAAEPAATEEGEGAMEELAEPATAAATLGIGDAAPAISVAKWIKGEPVVSFSPDKVYVVEFWATWCQPCLAGMPHIAKLQTEYGDKATFIGMTHEDELTISEFMTETARGSDKTWSETLTYTIACDDEEATNKAYMEAAGQNGIPCAFVVGKSGKIEWIGHPMDIDGPLKQIVDGTWDSEKARADYLIAKEAEAAAEAAEPKIGAAMRSGDVDAALAILNDLISRFPANTEFPVIRLSILLQENRNEEASKAATSLVEAVKDQPMGLGQVAWMLAIQENKDGIDLKVAHAAASRAVELTEEKNAQLLAALARVTFMQGNVAEAITIQKQALALEPGHPQLESLLAEYEAAAAPPAEAPTAPAQPEGDNPTEPAPPTDN